MQEKNEIIARAKSSRGVAPKRVLSDSLPVKGKKKSTSDLQRIKDILPGHYTVTLFRRKRGVHYGCKSVEGIEKEDDWLSVFDAIKLKFGERFLEVYHVVNHNHKNFFIYLK